MKKAVLVLVALVCLLAVACKKSPAKMTHEEKVATLPPKLQPLFKGSWKLDVNASSAMSSKAVEGKSGIKADIKFDKDVGKAAQFLAKTLTFGFEKTTMTRVYAEKYGEGLLSTESTGWLTIDDGMKNITLKDANDKETSYTVEEFEADEKLVLLPKDGGSYQVLIPKGKTPMAASPQAKAAGTTEAPSKPAKVVEPNAKYKKSAYKVGDRVVARWASSSFYMATVKTKTGDDYGLAWEDGTSGKAAVNDMVPVVKAKDIKVGDHVAACWHSCKSSLYQGVVEKKTPAGATVKWDDGSSASDVKDGDLTLF